VAAAPGARAWRIERIGDEVVETAVHTQLIGGAGEPAAHGSLAVADAAIEELREVRRFHSARGRHGVRRVRAGG
jgi:hypothetical protein